VIYIHDPFATVGDKFVMDADAAELVARPLSTACARVLVPVGTAEQIQEAVAVHIEHRDTLGVVGSQTMGEKGDARLSVRLCTWVLHAELRRVCRILGSRCAECKRKRKKMERDRQTFRYFHRV
jgi:hypothetical protein